MAGALNSAEAVAPQPIECPHCHEMAIVYDFLYGFSVCESCGKVNDGQDFVAQLFHGANSRPSGIFVGPQDTGLAASAATLAGGSRILDRDKADLPLHLHRKHLKLIANKLSLPAEVSKEADSYLERLRAAMPGVMRREDLAAGAIYLAIRKNSLPLTLLDLSEATQIGVFYLGRFYRQAADALNMPTPRVLPQSLLRRAVDRIVHESKDTTGKIIEDAEVVLKWMDKQLEIGSRHPLATVAAAIVVSFEMNNISYGLEYVASCLHLAEQTLNQRLMQIKDKFMSFSQLLPYSKGVGYKNILSYARALIRLSNVLVQEQPEDVAMEEEPGPATLALKQSQLASLGDATSDDLPRKRRRKRVRFSENLVEEQGREGEAAENSQGKGEENALQEDREGDDELESDLDMSDSELDGYLRSPEEVIAYQEAYQAIVGAGVGSPIKKKP